ncbi:MAG TPA: DUF4232 domain-containing protein [Streptosporangiaceae bacterium]|nr:DUF4232 domain-containing protein [Streptosporangiaceae bacterium]
MTSAQRLALTAVTALVAIALAACGAPRGGTGAASAGGPATTAPATSPAPATPSASPSATQPGTPPAAVTTTPECGAAQLTVSYTDNRQIREGALAGMSHADNVVTFVNKGSACWMRGYPGVAALNAAGQQIQQATRSSNTPDPLVVLKPGQTASALITGNTASCTKQTTAQGLLVTAPDQRISTRLGTYGTLCLQSLGVQQVQRGNAGGLHLR